jgi:ubiquinone/menaquinone biosynthesis C-methylase UbiE
MPETNFTAKQIQTMYDAFSSLPWFWELDAITCRATEISPYRTQLIGQLGLKAGSRVLDVACGTGLNFRQLQPVLGHTGHLVGLDLSAKTLNLAQKRLQKQGWPHAELVQTDTAHYVSQPYFEAALCTFAIEIIPNYQATLDMMYRAVKPGGRLGVLGFKPSAWNYFSWLNGAFAWMGVLFGGVDLNRDVRGYLAQHSREVFYEEVFGGFYYILVVEKPAGV